MTTEYRFIEIENDEVFYISPPFDTKAEATDYCKKLYKIKFNQFPFYRENSKISLIEL